MFLSTFLSVTADAEPMYSVGMSGLSGVTTGLTAGPILDGGRGRLCVIFIGGLFGSLVIPFHPTGP